MQGSKSKVKAMSKSILYCLIMVKESENLSRKSSDQTKSSYLCTLNDSLSIEYLPSVIKFNSKMGNHIESINQILSKISIHIYGQHQPILSMNSDFVCRQESRN